MSVGIDTPSLYLAVDELLSDPDVRGANSLVRFRTKKEGALIRFRLAADDDADQTKCRTNDCSDLWSVGRYVIWTERDGKRTSHDHIVAIIAESETVYLDEFQ